MSKVRWKNVLLRGSSCIDNSQDFLGIGGRERLEADIMKSIPEAVSEM